jgi:hypothetical protein
MEEKLHSILSVMLADRAPLVFISRAVGLNALTALLQCVYSLFRSSFLSTVCLGLLVVQRETISWLNNLWRGKGGERGLICATPYSTRLSKILTVFLSLIWVPFFDSL